MADLSSLSGKSATSLRNIPMDFKIDLAVMVTQRCGLCYDSLSHNVSLQSGTFKELSKTLGADELSTLTEMDKNG